MVDFARLRDVKPESVTETGKDWQAVAKAFDQARQHIEESVLKPLGTWTGPAATNARHSFGQQELQLQVAALELQAVQQVLDGFVQAVATAQQELQWALTEASKRGLTVDANGTVTATPTPVDQLPKNAALRQEAADSYRTEVAYAASLTADIAAAVQAATQADTKCAAELGKLAGESKLLDGSGRTGLAGAVQVAAKDLGEATRLAGTVEGDAVPTDFGRPGRLVGRGRPGWTRPSGTRRRAWTSTTRPCRRSTSGTRSCGTRTRTSSGSVWPSWPEPRCTGGSTTSTSSSRARTSAGWSPPSPGSDCCPP
ncbi:WXG100 family type VII secretion target [Kitasatospora sp. NPDC056531]|uniref:WXG100 family type VII secretion target n=1 Tax=Kitasatospora sp. NPDC056531 TaxID=3345856 RepID=UPI003697EDB3